MPLVVVSHSMINPLANNRRAHWWNTSPQEALQGAARLFGDNILIEAGAKMIIDLADMGLIDRLELSVTEVEGGDDPIDYKTLLAKFSTVKENVIDGTRFFTALK